MTAGTIAESIERFRKAFALAKIPDRDVKVTWDHAAGWCRLRCRLPSGRIVERVTRGDATARKSTEALMHEMSVWTLRAARRLKAGESFWDDSCVGGASAPAGCNVSATHDLKTWPEFFAAVIDGRKTFEVRRTDDRRFAVGDVLRLREWDPTSGAYTGRETARCVSYIVEGPPFLPAGLAVMGIVSTGGES